MLTLILFSCLFAFLSLLRVFLVCGRPERCPRQVSTILFVRISCCNITDNRFPRMMNQENIPNEMAYGNINEAAAAQDLADRADFARLDLGANA